jgi:hypothetical protein
LISIQSDAFSVFAALVDHIRTIIEIANHWVQRIQERIVSFDLIFPSSIATIGVAAFRETKIKSIIIPEGVQILPYVGFSLREQLSTAKHRSSLTRIGESVFKGTALSSIEIASGVTSIGHLAFSECGSLSLVTFGVFEASLWTSVFGNCPLLKTVGFGFSFSIFTAANSLRCSQVAAVILLDSVEFVSSNYF